MTNQLWKDNWADTRQRIADWWKGNGFVLGFWNGVQLSAPHADVPPPEIPRSLEQRWTDIGWRVAASRHKAAWTGYPMETLPVVDPSLGPGSLALYLGSPPEWQEETVWFHPCLTGQYRDCPPLKLDDSNKWWQFQLELMDRMMATSEGNYFVGCPDLVEHWDVLASLRDGQTLLMDMIENPDAVKERLAEIDDAWCKAYDEIYKRIRAQDGESMFGWFRTWAPGKVAKLQCDGCSMFSPEMFREFVVPSLTRQCEYLDYSMFHLDGSSCLDKLDLLLEIESLTAIEWTADPKVPSGGNACWYDMYQRILKAGKQVQVLYPEPHELEPLLDATGGNGIYFLVWAADEKRAEAYQNAVDRLR